MVNAERGHMGFVVHSLMSVSFRLASIGYVSTPELSAVWS